jgi:hypothetical protein
VDFSSSEQRSDTAIDETGKEQLKETMACKIAIFKLHMANRRNWAYVIPAT